MSFLGFQKSDVRLVYNLFKMTIRDRYLGSMLGLVWAVLNPILLLGMYTFVFGFVFKAKMPGSDTSLAYVIWLFCGLVPYLAICECLTMTTMSVVSGASMVKNIAFKAETLPLAATLMGVVPFAVGMFFLLVLLGAAGSYPSRHIVALIPVVALQFIFLAGLGLFLGATTVFIRDISQVIATVTLLIVFFTPVFYSLEMLPRFARVLTKVNPFFYIMQPYRDILINHQWPDWRGMFYLTVLSSLLIYFGLKYFRRLKGYFEMAL